MAPGSRHRDLGLPPQTPPSCRQLDRVYVRPQTPSGGFSPPVPQGRRGESFSISLKHSPLRKNVEVNFKLLLTAFSWKAWVASRQHPSIDLSITLQPPGCHHIDVLQENEIRDHTRNHESRALRRQRGLSECALVADLGRSQLWFGRAWLRRHWSACFRQDLKWSDSTGTKDLESPVSYLHVVRLAYCPTAEPRSCLQHDQRQSCDRSPTSGRRGTGRI